jgi:hypothetical protein
MTGHVKKQQNQAMTQKFARLPQTFADPEIRNGEVIACGGCGATFCAAPGSGERPVWDQIRRDSGPGDRTAPY